MRNPASMSKVERDRERHLSSTLGPTCIHTYSLTHSLTCMRIHTFENTHTQMHTTYATHIHKTKIKTRKKLTWGLISEEYGESTCVQWLLEGTRALEEAETH